MGPNKPNRENWVVEVTVKDLYDAISHRNSRQLRYWEQFLLLMEPDRKLFLQYDDYVFFFGE